MSRHTPDPLDPELRRAGAVLVTDHGALVADSFGSVAGETALVQGGVGMADRADLTVLAISGGTETVARTVERVAGMRPERGMSWGAAEAWWCVLASGKVLVLAEGDVADRLAGSLRSMAPGSRMAEIADVSDEYSVISLVGPIAGAVLEGAGLPAGEQPSIASFVEYEIAGRATLILRESPRSFLMLSTTTDAVTAWTELRNAGRPFNVGFVGHEALARLHAAERGRRRHAAA